MAALRLLAVRLRHLAVAVGAALPRALSVTASPGKARVVGLNVRKSKSKMHPSLAVSPSRKATVKRFGFVPERRLPTLQTRFTSILLRW